MTDDLTTELQERVRAAAADGTPLALRGNGTKAFLGRPVDGEPLDLAGHAGILNYQPKELVVTARCGTTLADLQAVLAEQGQMLPFEPPSFGPGATIGATIACGLSGPARPYAGAARDLVLGTRVLTGRGQVLRFGGEVMKNVAGYDISRLMTGAYGTLGVLLDVSVKVLPIPPARRTLAQPRPPAEAIELMNRWAARPLPINATCYDGERLWVRLAGAEQGVAAAVPEIGGDAVDEAEADAFWDSKIREQRHGFFAGDQPLWRLSVPQTSAPLELPGKQLIEWGGAQRWLRGYAAPDTIRSAAARVGGHATLFRGGDRAGEVFQRPPPELMRLHLSLKQAFDPNRILNPGRMFDGV